VSRMHGLLRLSFTAFLLFIYVSAAAAVELDGVAMPEAQTVAGARLALNGLACGHIHFSRYISTSPLSTLSTALPA
jgi:hypothetical protein